MPPMADKGADKMGSREDLIHDLYGHLPSVPARKNSIKWKSRGTAGTSIFLPAIVVTCLGGVEAGIGVAALLFLWHAVKSWMRGY